MIYVLNASPILPLKLLAISWRRSNRKPIELSIQTLGAALFLAAAVRGLKLISLGSDYSNRLFTTIGVNPLVSLALGTYLGVKRRLLPALAAGILALEWFLV